MKKRVKKRRAALYRIKNPDVRKVALVRTPASGKRWHLLKSGAPDLYGGLLLKSAPDDDAALEEWVDGLSAEEAAAVVAEVERQEIADTFERVEVMQRELAEREEQPLAKASPAPEDLAAALAGLAAYSEREAMRRRAEQGNREVIAAFDGAANASQLYHLPAGSAGRAADLSMQWNRQQPPRGAATRGLIAWCPRRLLARRTASGSSSSRRSMETPRFASVSALTRRRCARGGGG